MLSLYLGLLAEMLRYRLANDEANEDATLDRMDPVWRAMTPAEREAAAEHSARIGVDKPAAAEFVRQSESV